MINMFHVTKKTYDVLWFLRHRLERYIGIYQKWALLTLSGINIDIWIMFGLWRQKKKYK